MSGYHGKIAIPSTAKWIVVCEGEDCVSNAGWYHTCSGGAFYTKQEFKDKGWGKISNEARLTCSCCFPQQHNLCVGGGLAVSMA